MLEVNPACRATVDRLGYRDAEDVLLDPRGATVRCAPTRRTVLQRSAAGELLFRKLRWGRTGDAAAVWRWLHELPGLGLPAPQPVLLACRGRGSAVVMRAVVGRPLDALLAAADDSAAWGYAVDVVLPLIRRLHRQRLVFRDLYWGHLIAASIRDPAPPTFIDVERVLRPRLRWRRWLIKDLAGLVATWPGGAERARGLAAAYGLDPATARRVVAKAARIAARRPRYGATLAPTAVAGGG